MFQVKDDLKKGENGAKKLSKEQLDDLEELLKITNINLDDTEKVNLTLAEHLINLAEARPRKVGKSTYQKMNELLNSIKKSGYDLDAEENTVAKVIFIEFSFEHIVRIIRSIFIISSHFMK